MKLISILLLVVFSSFANETLLERIENEVGKDLGVKLTILANISEERNPKNIHHLCVIENASSEISYVLNFDTTINELSLIDEFGSHHISNKQFWTINQFSASNTIGMVSFYGVDAIKGSLSSTISKDGTILTMQYLYSMGNYKTKKLVLAFKDGKWGLFRTKLLKNKPIRSIFFKAKKNFLGIVTGIGEIVIR